MKQVLASYLIHYDCYWFISVIVPVYDCRDYAFDFRGDLDRIDELLPLWHGEIPPNSFIVVAYTMTQYEKDKSYYLSTNILYAILFATEYHDNGSEAEPDEE